MTRRSRVWSWPATRCVSTTSRERALAEEANEEIGVPARELSDAELERQGLRAHETRHWMFLHGTAEQFRTHTRRMLELENEYLRRHPQRTWQGRGGADSAPPAGVPLEGD